MDAGGAFAAYITGNVASNLIGRLVSASEGFAEYGQTAFDAGVGRKERRGNKRDARCHIHDKPIAIGAEHWQSRPGEQDGCNQIDFDHRSDLGVGRIVKPTGPDTASIVDENIKPTQLF
jgi:hypothetical protein